MTRILAHKPDPGNRVGLHYSRFRRYSAFPTSQNQLLAFAPPRKNPGSPPPIREVGLTALLVADLDAGALAVPGHAALGPSPGIALMHLDQQKNVGPALVAELMPTFRAAFARFFFYAAFGMKQIPLRGT